MRGRFTWLAALEFDVQQADADPLGWQEDRTTMRGMLQNCTRAAASVTGNSRSL